ncbi:MULTISPECIES: energy transducer TonB [Winogradskyella]|uniref:energy transducer TonB n=1 Tax=Winogradskyella TaxID=286104 RepID=UPI0015CC7507|nr:MULTISPECIES: energy transducer TonB [Winogradskyella]QXP79422.1 energy transducer TonB [Winogradskyella sp. HaHa_3_26]
MELKKNPKANVGRNSSLYFAVGLNVMLLLTYLGLEHKTYEKEEIKIDLLMLDDQFDEDIPITTINIPPPPPPKQVVTEAITIVEDTEEVEETVVESTEVGQDDVIEEVAEVEDVVVDEVEEDLEVPFALIEKVPQFPGCKGNNAELKACFEEKMQAHLQKNFRYPEAAADLNIQGKVYVFFLIDKTGKVTKIKSRGPDKLLETEAERIISLLPKMIPGQQRDMPVSMPYSVPINFKLMQ